MQIEVDIICVFNTNLFVTFLNTFRQSTNMEFSIFLNDSCSKVLQFFFKCKIKHFKILLWVLRIFITSASVLLITVVRNTPVQHHCYRRTQMIQNATKVHQVVKRITFVVSINFVIIWV